jgi:hypothetical protein
MAKSTNFHYYPENHTSKKHLSNSNLSMNKKSTKSLLIKFKQSNNVEELMK